MVKILIEHKSCEQKDCDMFLVGQEVLQMSQISRTCVIASFELFLGFSSMHSYYSIMFVLTEHLL